MFSEYFIQQSEELRGALSQNIKKKQGAAVKKSKDLKVYIDFYNFIKNHIPAHFTVSSGKVRNEKHILNRNCDLLIYHKWAPKFLEMSGGYVLSDHLYTVMSLETKVSQAALLAHATMTNALKTLYAGDLNAPDNQIIPMYSILFAYESQASMRNLRSAMNEIYLEKEIPLNRQVDLLCVLNRGIMIKDWENGGDYKVVETGDDTLMWFYILLLEYLDRDGKVGIDVRQYIKSTREYKEY